MLAVPPTSFRFVGLAQKKPRCFVFKITSGVHTMLILFSSVLLFILLIFFVSVGTIIIFKVISVKVYVLIIAIII